MSVKVKLKELRNSKGISQNELARQLKMSLANVQRIEYNKVKSIPFNTLESICKILKCEIGDLLVLNKGMKMSSLVYGIAQLEFYNTLKSNYKDVDVYELCKEIYELENLLDEYITDKKEEIETKIHDAGSCFFDIGNNQLMVDICQFLGIKNTRYLNILNKLWDGIGTWIA